MRRRCESPTESGFAHYGGRGITVDPRWASFAAFLEDMGPRPSPLYTIERVDNDGPYAPENCRWADRTEQANNRRSSRIVSHAGESLTLAEWSRRTGIKWHTLWQRLANGWSVEKALTEPVRRW